VVKNVLTASRWNRTRFSISKSGRDWCSEPTKKAALDTGKGNGPRLSATCSTAPEYQMAMQTVFRKLQENLRLHHLDGNRSVETITEALWGKIRALLAGK